MRLVEARTEAPPENSAGPASLEELERDALVALRRLNHRYLTHELPGVKNRRRPLHRGVESCLRLFELYEVS